MNDLWAGLILVRLSVGILLGRIGGEFGLGMMMGLRGGVGRIRIRICGCGGLIGGFVLVFGCLGLTWFSV